MKLGKSLVSLVLGCSAAFGSGNFGYADEPRLEQKAEGISEKADKLWVEGKIDDAITLYLSLKTCNEIMGDKVEYVKYDSEQKKNNFDELVYQTNVDKEKRKPVLVLFHHNNSDQFKNNTHSMHSAIIMRRWNKDYADKIKLVAYETDVDPVLAAQNYQGLNQAYKIEAIPAFQMYAQDKLINSLNKGPENSETLKQWLPRFSEKWISPVLQKQN